MRKEKENGNGNSARREVEHKLTGKRYTVLDSGTGMDTVSLQAKNGTIIKVPIPSFNKYYKKVKLSIYDLVKRGENARAMADDRQKRQGIRR